MTEAIDYGYDLTTSASRILVRAMEEVIGWNDMKRVFAQARLPHYLGINPVALGDVNFKINHISLIQSALESLHGLGIGKGLALRSGRAFFKHGLREFSPLLGLNHLDFRLLPPQAKVKICAQSLAEALKKDERQNVYLVEEDEFYYWVVEHCPVCWGRESEAPCCYLVVGFLQEALSWLSGGKFFRVEEKKCMARGDTSCTFRFEKRPHE